MKPLSESVDSFGIPLTSDSEKLLGEGLEAAVTEGARGDWKKEGYKIALIPHGDWQGDYEIPDFNPKEHDFVLVVRDKGGKEAGYAHVTHHSPITVGIAEVAIKKPHKRKGIGTEIYRQAEKISGKKLIPSEEFSDEAEALWSQPNRPFGESLDPWGLPLTRNLDER
jgi:GNAT superfamily N-acetyltransferase